jgi:hypothetical protein
VNHAILNTLILSTVTSGFANAGIFPVHPDKLIVPLKKGEKVLPSSVLAPGGLENISSPEQGVNSGDLINASSSLEDVHPFTKT